MVGWDRFVRVRLSAGYRRCLDGDQARCVSVDTQDTNICRNAELPGPIDDLYVGFSLGTAFDL